MPYATILNRREWIAAATALAAAGFLLNVAPSAQAAPGCSQYGFNGNFSLKQSNGDTVVFSSIGPVASGNATATGGTTPLRGTVTGGIQGDKLDFYIVWNVNAPGTTATSQGDYTGYVSADGFAHGDTAEHNAAFGDTPRAQASWDSTVPLVCSDPVAPAPAPAPPTTVVQKAPDVQLPNIVVAPSSAAPAPPPKPLQGPTVSATPGLTGVTFHVTDRSGVASRCTYTSEGFTSDSFALPANGSFDLFVPAIREFRTRTGTITCDNGTSAPTSVNF
jgi:hypothetical protein